MIWLFGGVVLGALGWYLSTVIAITRKPAVSELERRRQAWGKGTR